MAKARRHNTRGHLAAKLLGLRSSNNTPIVAEHDTAEGQRRSNEAPADTNLAPRAIEPSGSCQRTSDNRSNSRLSDNLASTGTVALDDGRELELAAPFARLIARVIDALIVVLLSQYAVQIVDYMTGQSLDWSLFQPLRPYEQDATEGMTRPNWTEVIIIFSTWFLIEPVLNDFRTTPGPHRGWGTLGKRIMGIRLVSARSGQSVSRRHALNRWSVMAGAAFLMLALGTRLEFLGPAASPIVIFIAMLWSPARQGWHDQAAGTLVVRSGSMPLRDWRWRRRLRRM